MNKLQKGFTLIELMIVVAIIGILAAVAIPAYQDYIIKAKLSKVQSGLDPIKMAMAMYYQEQGGFVAGPTGGLATAIMVTHQNQGGSTASDPFYQSLGIGTYPMLPNEIKEMTLEGDNSGAKPMTKIALTLQNIKSATCGADTQGGDQTSATNNFGIDNCTLVMTGTASSTSIEWSYHGTALGNLIANKYFR